MQTIFVQVKCELGQAYQVAQSLVEVGGVSEVFSISGPYDLLAKCYVGDGEDVGHFVNQRVQVLAGRWHKPDSINHGEFRTTVPLETVVCQMPSTRGCGFVDLGDNSSANGCFRAGCSPEFGRNGLAYRRAGALPK